jgi:hypothetical protein
MNKFKVGDHIIRTENPLDTNTAGLKGVITALPGPDNQYSVLVGKYSWRWLEEYMILDPDHIVSPEATYFRYRKRSMLEMIE